MTNKIDELWGEALDKAVPNTYSSLTWTQVEKIKQVFAELIVQECMTQIEEVKQIKAGHAGSEYTQGFDDGMFVAIRTIEEHFGVEE